MPISFRNDPDNPPPDWQPKKATCGHGNYADGYCAEMGCPNYVNKHLEHREERKSLTKTQQGQIYALKLYRFYREQGLPPFMAMAAVIDSGRALAYHPVSYLPKFTARVAMSVWAAQQYMQWVEARMIDKNLHGYWFVGRLSSDSAEVIAGMYEEVQDIPPGFTNR